MAVQARAPLAPLAQEPGVASPPLVTGEDLFKMGDLGRTELVKGVIVQMSPTGYLHGRLEKRFSVVLDAFVRERKLGEVFSGEVGIYTARHPDTVRGADVAFVSNERMAQVKSSSYLDVAPELVVEILSPDDRWSDLMEKLGEYLNIGVLMVWLADPKTRSVYVYRSLTDVQRLTADDVLSGGDVLPGFSVSVGALLDSA